MSHLTITVEADTNDADYIEKTSAITQEQLDRFQPLFEAIQKVTNLGQLPGFRNYRYNWPDSEWRDSNPTDLYEEYDIPSDLIEEFQEFVPYGDDGVHTIKSVAIREVIREETIEFRK